MKIVFNKDTKIFSKYKKGRDTFNHYTNSENVNDIIQNGLMPGYEYGGISGYLGKDDYIKNTMTDWKSLESIDERDQILDLQRNKLDMLKRHKSNVYNDDDTYIEHYLNPEFRPHVHYNSIDQVVNSETPVRLVTNVDLNELDGGVNLNINKNGDRLVQKNKAKRDLDESILYPSKLTKNVQKYGERTSLSPELIKIQLPYGAVTKDNSQTYLNNLKDIDPSKFDVSDKYTRRIYNLYAKNNNLPVLPGSNMYSKIVFNKETKTFGVHADRVNELYIDKGLNERKMNKTTSKPNPEISQLNDFNSLTDYMINKMPQKVSQQTKKLPINKMKMGGTKSQTPERVLDFMYKKDPDHRRIPGKYKLKKIMENLNYENSI